MNLIDLDVLVYRAGFSNGENLQDTLLIFENYIQTIKQQTGCDESRLILSGDKNFRKAILPSYKDRKSVKPEFYSDLRSHALDNLGAELAPDFWEADDLLASLQTDDTIICSVDKDLLQVPGKHLRFKRNFSENELVIVTEFEAKYNYYIQMIMGDAIDSVPGIAGYGPKKAEKLLEGKSPEEMKAAVINLYEEKFGDDWYSNFDITARLLFLLRGSDSHYSSFY